MRRKKLVLLLGFVLVALAIPVANLLLPLDGASALPKQATAIPLWDQAGPILAKKCASCHATNGPLPFYAGLPVAKGLLAEDVKAGLAIWNLAEELSREGKVPIAETTLAKVEFAIANNAMPPTRYLIMHWNHRLSGEEKRALLEWTKQCRKKYFVTPGVDARFENGPLQPLPEALALDKAKVALGDTLFHDKRLSKDNSLSCASCHGLDKGGTDQQQFSEGIKKQLGGINSPTVFNAGFIYKQFWDGRAGDLFEQADGPVNNPIEMGSNWKEVIEKLKGDEPLVKTLTALYPEGLSDKSIRDAIATFEQSLVTPSPFDQYLRGKSDALSEDEKKGHELFVSRGCATCHVGKVLGGQSFEKLGLFKDYFAPPRKLTDADRGRISVTKLDRDLHKFKVPMLRNVALTQPYFHDGSATTLEKAVEAMASLQIEDGLPPAELKVIVAFLRSLTGSFRGKRLN